MVRKMKSKRKKAVENLDEIHSLLIRSKNDKCVICGSRERLQCGHLFTRAHYATRWDTNEDGNCHVQCARCNLLHEYNSYPFFNWFINNFGKDKLDDLYARHNTQKIYKTYELIQLHDEFKSLHENKKKD